MLHKYFKKGLILLIISLFLAILTAIECQAEDYEQLKANIQGEINGYNASLAEKQTQIESLQVKIQNYENTLNRKDSITSDLELEINKKEQILNDKLSELTENVSKKDKIQIDNHLPFISPIMEENKKLNTELEEVVSSKLETKSTYKELTTSLATLEAEKADLENAINTKTAEFAEVERKASLLSSYGYSEADIDLMCAIVAQECNSSYEGALAVISCAMNRANSAKWGYLGGDPLSQLKAHGQFCYSIDGYWRNRLNGNYPDYVRQAVMDGITGTTNHSYLSFRAYPSGNSVNIGGNWYF